MIAVDLLEPFAYGFFQRGLVVATHAGALCGLVGVYVVIRSMSYIGHGLSHAVFGGAAIAAVMGVSFFLGAGLWGVFAALLIGRVARRGGIGADAAIGVVTTASFAIGLVIQSRSGAVARSLDTVLFGNVLGVFRRDVVAIVVVGIAVVAVIVALQRELAFISFDPEVGSASGINVGAVDAVFMVTLSATVLVSVRVIGALLISAMLVLPSGTARMLTNSINRMLWISPLLGASFGFVGMYVSWYADVPSGAVITLVGTAVFGAVYLGTDVARRRAIANIDDHAMLV
jgi:manganese/iron transport system permease protein/iron/zinc/copper transport system permease protein